MADGYLDFTEALAMRPVGLALAALLLIFSPLTTAFAQEQAPTLYQFTGGIDGGSPVGGVVADAQGTLYGETSVGGSSSCTSKTGVPAQGCGTVYSWNATAGLTVLATFTGPNGAYGISTPTISGSLLYGTTTNGGANDDGVVFSMHLDGSGYSILHQFSGSDGRLPLGALRIGANGVLYGITEYGGGADYGVLFSITPQGVFSILHTFTGGATDGRYPSTLLISSTGVIVGSAGSGGRNAPQFCSYGCGVIFEYAPAQRKYSVVYLYDGAHAIGGYIGSLGPGPTVYGSGLYAPYSVSLAKGLTDYGSFEQYQKGNLSSGPLVAPNGHLIGVLGIGPIETGTLYSSTKTSTETLAFLNNSRSQPIFTPDGAIIGTEASGSLCSTCGAIWKYMPAP